MHISPSTKGDTKDCRTNETTNGLGQRNFGYRLDGLTKPDSPLRNAITYCNRVFFPIVAAEPNRRTDVCYSGVVVNRGSSFSTQRCAPEETACQTKFIISGAITVILKQCKHRDACMSNFRGNGHNCLSEDAGNNKQPRVCRFCCTRNLCNNSTDIQDY
nr:uncharacterized protein LOC101242418 [Ciona intestinalis]|eukprot:XP_004227373.1 uncharacterized protein LOC101242418 [Ciona intestinalis]